jgi:hypothetical protein
MLEIQKSEQGIAHLRKASPRMPINSNTAHPFIYKSTVYAHNGIARNWLDLLEKLAHSATAAGDKPLQDYLSKASTDSMVLGPFIESRDFSTVNGALGLVWMTGKDAYAFHACKELAAAQVTWNYAGTKERHTFSLVVSTFDIIAKALAATPGIKYDAVEIILAENVLYSVSQAGIEDQGKLPVSGLNSKDAFSSGAEPTITGADCCAGGAA